MIGCLYAFACDFYSRREPTLLGRSNMYVKHFASLLLLLLTVKNCKGLSTLVSALLSSLAQALGLDLTSE